MTLAGWEQGGQRQLVILNPLARRRARRSNGPRRDRLLAPRFASPQQSTQEFEVPTVATSKVLKKHRSKKSTKGKRRAATAVH